MNPRTRRIALFVIALIAVLASTDALAHSYAGLYGWAVHHRLGGWQAWSWPAEIDVFLVVGELALYVAYLDAWPGRQRVWPWVTAVTGLTVSVAGNIGHIQPVLGEPVTLADRLTAATSPVAAFAGLMIGLLVLKMSSRASTEELVVPPVATEEGHSLISTGEPVALLTAERLNHPAAGRRSGQNERLYVDATLIIEAGIAAGQSVSQRALAEQLRERGHRFSNAQLRTISRIADTTRNSLAA
jgi:Protein of unknown function (DUF2637)